MDLICIVEVDWLGFRLDPGPLAGRIGPHSTVTIRIVRTFEEEMLMKT